MKRYTATPNYAEAANDDNWVVVAAPSPDVAVNDLTKLALGTVIAPTSTTTTGYYAAQVEDLSRLMKGWSYLTKASIGPRNTLNQYTKSAWFAGEPYAYVAEINGFANGDTFAVLEGLQESQAPYSSTATSSDYGVSQWSHVRNAGLIPTISVDPDLATTSFFQPENASIAYSRLIGYNSVDFVDTNYGATDSNGNFVSSTKNYGSSFVPTPDNIGGSTVANWYITASGDDTAQTNLVASLLPDFTTDGQRVLNVAIGRDSTVVTLNGTNAAFVAGQTVTVVTNGAALNTYLPYLGGTTTAMGWFAGKIISVTTSGGNTVLTTDLNDTTVADNNPLIGSLNSNVTFTGTVTGTNTITITAFGATTNYGIAQGQTLTLSNAISSITSTASTFTVNTTLNHSLYAGQTVTVAGVTGAGFTNYNGDWTVASTPSGTSFTVASTINPGSTSSGNVTSATASQKAIIGKITGNGVGASFLLDSTGGPYDYNTAIANGTGIPFTASYTDNNVRAFAATITNQTLQVNHNDNKYDCQYFTTPYYSTPSAIVLASALSTTGATTQVVFYNQSSNDVFLTATIPSLTLIGGDQYQEITVTADVTVSAGATATATVSSFTPSYAFPAYITAMYWSLDDNNSRYGKDLVFPVVPMTYKNAPVARFRSMTPTTITETISGSTYYYGKVGSTTYSSTPYIVTVDDVSNISAGDTLTFRQDYNPWFSNYTTTAPPAYGDWSKEGDPVPWTWSVTDYGGAGTGVTGATGATTLNLVGVDATSLPLVKGQSVAGLAALADGTTVVSWTNTTITFSSGLTSTVAAAANLRFYPGSSGYNYWKVQSVDTTNNTFVIYGSSADYDFSSTAYANNDNKNFIYAYDNHFHAGNTLDISNATGKGAGAVGLYSTTANGADNGPEVLLNWHATNTIVGSYQTGPRYVGSQSIGDQETITPFQIGTLIGSTLALDIIAQSSSAIAVSPLPNTANRGTYDPTSTLPSDYNQYGNSVYNGAQWSGFADITSSSAYSTNYTQQNQFPVVIGRGETQEIVLVTKSNTTGGGSALPTAVDGSNSFNVPMLWSLVAGQSFQYDHVAGEPVSTPNFVYNTASSVNHAKGTPVIGTPDFGTVYNSTTGPNYKAAASLVAQNTTQNLTVTADTQMNVASPWLASGNQGQPNLSTTLASPATAGSSTLSLVSANGFPDAYPSVYQSGIYYLPPAIGRVAGNINSGVTAIPFVLDGDLPLATPFFVRLGSEILQVSSVTQVAAGGTTYSALNTTTATTAAHGDFTPIHLNSLSTSVQYKTLEVPHFYLADAVVSGTMSGTSNTIQGTAPATLGTGQTISGASLATGTVVSSYTPSLITISTTFPSATSGATFTNSATFAMAMEPALLTSITSVTSGAGGTNTVFSSLPSIGSALTGTGLASPSYISGLDTGGIRLAVNVNPTSYTTGATFTSTLTFTCSTTSGSRFLTIKNITVNGVSYAKVGTTNPTWNGRTLASYMKVGAPITTTSGGGIAAKYIQSIQVSAGTVYLSAAATATVTTATVTSVITMTANTGRAVIVTPNASSEINKLLVANSTIADNAGSTAYITAGSTITKTVAVSSTQTEVWLSAASGTTGAWTGRTALLSTTFSGSSGFSNLITGVTNASALYQVGSLVYGNAYIPDNTTITNISGTTITLSNQTTNGFTPVTGTSFKIGSSLNIGKAYTSLPVSPLPCQLPSGTTLYLTFGNYTQSITTSATAAAGATNISVTSFQPNYNFSTTSYYYGVAQTSTGGYGYGANITVGLASDLYPNQAIILQANNSTSLTNVITVAEYTRQSARGIVVNPFTPTYAYDGQSVGYSLTGDFTIGSNQILNASSTSGLSVGQQVFSTYLSSNIQYFITAISGTTITLSDTAASTGSTQAFSVYATTFTASLPMTLGGGTSQETVYPISLPAASNGFWNVNLAEPTMYQHDNNSPFVYYAWPSPLNVGDTTYRPDFGKFFMWDGYQWLTARVNTVRAVYAIMGAVGGGDVTNITLLDPFTNAESAPDTFSGVPSTGFNTYFGGERSADPNGNEWTGDTLAAVQLHVKTKVPQGRAVSFRSLALEASYISAPSVASIHFSPGDNMEIGPDITNSVFWYYADLDKSPQTGYQVKIYDDYTYNRSDFSPDDNTIIPFWSTTGNDDTSEVEITPQTGWVNGERYWVFVRVSKSFHQKQWWGNWQSKSLVVTVDQPATPIMSIYTDNTNSLNKLAIQSTDNLIGTNNGSFSGGLGQWTKGANDTASTTVTDLIDGIPLGATLTTSGQITSLPVGATGYVKTTGGTFALGSTNGTGTFVVSGNAALTADALGFPTSGTFWVTIGSENFLVKNLMDGNNTGDTFQIITRGYKNPNTGASTTPATHSVGDQVLFGLQNPLYVGTTATIDWKHQNTVSWTTTTSSLVRWSNGHAAYNETATRQPLGIKTQTQGDKNATDHVTVYDPNGLLSSKDVGSTVVLSLHQLHSAAKINQFTTDTQGNTAVKQLATPDRTLTGNDVREIEMKIKSVHDIWDNTANKQQKLLIGRTTTQSAGAKGLNALLTLPITPAVSTSQKFLYNSNNGCINLSKLPAGTRLTIHTDGFSYGGKTLSAADLVVTLTAPWGPKDTVIHIKRLDTAAGFKVGDGSAYVIPANCTITWSPPVVFTGTKRVTFTGKYTDKKTFAGQRLGYGDLMYVNKGRTVPAVKATKSGSYTKTVVTPHTQKVNVDSQQSFVVDFLTSPTVSTGGVLGTLTGSSFTIGSGSTTYSYNAIAFAASPGSVTGANVSTGGLAPTSTVRALTTVVGGTYATWTAVTFNDSTGTQTNVSVQNTDVTGSTPSSPVFTNLTAMFTPSSSLTIAAGSQSIPITSSVPKFAFPKNTVVTLRYPAFFGDNVLAVDPTVDGTAEISTYPTTGWFTQISPSPVNAGQLYSLAAFSKVIIGSGSPTFTPRLDWYDSNGNLLKSSDGTASLGGNGHTVGSTNSVAIGVTLNSSAGAWGQGWYPTAMVATAPQKQLLGTATGFTGTVSSGTGTFTIGGSGVAIALKAGTPMTNSDGVQYSTTTSTAVGATQLPVRFVAGIAVSSTTSFYADASYVVPAFQWTSAKAVDVYGLSGVMMKALNAPSLGSYSTSSSEMPSLTTAAVVGATNSVPTAVVLPSTTPVGGVNSLYVFDPVGDFGTHELHLGTDLNVLWANTTSAIAIGATQVSLTSVVGLAPGSPLTLEYGGGNQETVYVDSGWAGSSTVAIAAPYFTKAHAKGVRAYAPTAGLASEIQTTQAVNTPVAVLNWGPDGYIPAQNSTYQYKVEKSENGGRTWTTLRHGSALKADDTGVAYITDYEAVPGLTTSYRATATHVADPNAADYTVTGAPSQQLKANVITNQNWWLASTSDDSLRYPMLVKTGYSETQKHPAGVFYPLGSTRPITLAGTPTGRDGSITVTWTDLANFDNFLALLNKGETLVLTNPVESDRKYIFINQDVSITHNAANSPYREITINYVEAAPPSFGYTYGS